MAHDKSSKIGAAAMLFSPLHSGPHDISPQSKTQTVAA